MKKSPSKGKQTKEKKPLKASTAKSVARSAVKSAAKAAGKSAGPKRAGKPVTKKASAKPATVKAVKKPAARPAPAKTASKTAKAAIKPKAAAVKKPVAKATPTTGKVTTVNLKSKTGAKVAVPVVISTPPPPPEPPRRQVSSGALRQFEQAVKVFNRRYFDDAKEMFEALLEKHPNDVEVVARAQMYIQVCKQKLSATPSTPRNADELYDRGVYALNIGDFTQAKQFFEKALRLRPDAPHLLYSLAATLAQAGAQDQALDYLRRSIQLSPRLRTQAYNDADFSNLHENKQFLELLGMTSPFDLLDSRR
jgi:tetratricopeptide (TPR) repeat protein